MTKNIAIIRTNQLINEALAKETMIFAGICELSGASIWKSVKNDQIPAGAVLFHK